MECTGGRASRLGGLRLVSRTMTMDYLTARREPRPPCHPLVFQPTLYLSDLSYIELHSNHTARLLF